MHCSSQCKKYQEYPMSQPKPTLSRRTIFAGAGTAGAIAAVASLLPAAQPVQEAAVEPLKPPPANGGGYSLSAHVQRYYKTTRV
jgi:cysteine synthase